MARKRVCVLGAGAAGLACARHLSERGDRLAFDVYEQTCEMGGTWIYSDGVGDEHHAIHTSMYKNMRTNLPLEIMQFPDFPSNSAQSFVSHTEVLDYLRDYANHFELYQFIKFNHRVIKISRVNDEWVVVIRDLRDNFEWSQTYDSVFVCNGRYSKPKYPKANEISGLQTFVGKIIHSHDYRIPEVYDKQTVLILGGGPSGIDISVEVAQCARNVIFCHSDEPYLHLPSNINQELAIITNIFNSEIHLSNGKIYGDVNAIIFATGYHYDFTFLDESCGIRVNNNGRVEGIYLHLINTSHPSMAILGITTKILPFALYNQQALFFIKTLTKEIKLPSKSDMESDTLDDLAMRASLGKKEKDAHKMNGGLIWKYYDKLTRMAALDELRPVVKLLFDDLRDIRKENITGYKDINFDIISDTEYVVRQ